MCNKTVLQYQHYYYYYVMGRGHNLLKWNNNYCLIKHKMNPLCLGSSDLATIKSKIYVLLFRSVGKFVEILNKVYVHD